VGMTPQTFSPNMEICSDIDRAATVVEKVRRSLLADQPDDQAIVVVILPIALTIPRQVCGRHL